MTPLLSVQELRIRMPSAEGPVTIVDGVSFDVEAQECLGIAGESGSGKTISVLALLGLQPTRAVVSGRALFEGRDLIQMRESHLRRIRGNEIAVVFQDPMTALHPMLSIERQLTEHMLQHLGIDEGEARKRAISLLEEVRIPNASQAIRAHPHQFSGGMRQRVVIAMALACQPKLLIADEPSTALDVTVQAGILELMDQLRRDRHMSIIHVTHDLGVMSSVAERLAVFYAGRIVETGTTRSVLTAPQHPYTKHLLMALPDPQRGDRPLVPIPGQAATPQSRPPGCAFHPRCSYARHECTTMVPALATVEQGWLCACPVAPFKAALNSAADETGRLQDGVRGGRIG